MEKTELIRKSAIKVIARYGYHNTKVQMIADEAGIANGTVYYYFKSKQEILEHIYDFELDKFSRFFDELEKGKDTVLQKLDTFMKYSFKELEDNYDVLKILIQEGIFTSKQDTKVNKLIDKLQNKLSRLLGKGCESGELKAIDVDSFSFIIINLVFYGIYEFMTNENARDYNNIQTQLTNFVLNGIRMS